MDSHNFEAAFDTYDRDVNPVIALYKDLYKKVTVDAEQARSKDEVWADVSMYLNVPVRHRKKTGLTKTVPRIILSGPVGSGKGTQCAMLVRQLGVVHLSTGDMLRDEIQAGTFLGEKVKGYVTSGALGRCLSLCEAYHLSACA